jgi:formylglycine-generating enzyme required for sulfatase activity
VGTGSIAAASRHVGGFAILDREVTVEEFIRFLNADVNEELKRPPEQRVWNRTRGHTIWTQTKRAASGRFEVHPAFETLPASGISFVQAEAYAWWMTAEAAKLGKPVVYAIPTDLEWEKAARGADGRPYPYGWVFHALWQKHGRSTQKMTPEKVQSFPVDESPYGVFDMMGSQLEWCDRSAATQGFDDSRTLRGAPWSLTEVRTLFQEWEFARDIAMAETGFRIVIRDVAPESRPTTR